MPAISMRNVTPSISLSESWIFRIILGCFFLSGVTGLMYEVVWSRLLGLVFGNTVYAISIVLAAFMGGLALGSYLGGRWADRLRRPLFAYGLLEVGIGAYGLLSPFLLEGVGNVYQIVAGAWVFPHPGAYLIRFLLAILVLFFPTFLMGVTFPLLSRRFVPRVDMVGHRVGWLYALNTWGAVVGAFSAGFLLFPTVGLVWTIRMAAIINFIIGLIAFLLERTTSPAEFSTRPVTTPESFQPLPKDVQLILVAFALSGFTSFLYEVAWTRALVLILGSSIYAFSTVLTTFLIGIAAGSHLYASIWAHRPATIRRFAWLQIGIAATAFVILPLFERLPLLFLALFPLTSPSHTLLLGAKFFISFLVIFPSTLFMGATMPCVVQMISHRQASVGSDVGIAYSFNTLGNILGAIITGFFLVPILGIQSSIKVGILLNVYLGLFCLWVWARSVSAFTRSAVALFALLAWIPLLTFPPWDPMVLNSGVAVYPKTYLRQLREGKPFRRNGTVIYHREGLNGTVAVIQDGKARFLIVAGKTDASTSADKITQLMLGHIPLLLHPKPESVLVVGLGSGMTAGAIAQYPINRLDIVEIEPAVAEAFRFFLTENRHVLQDPRTRLILEDARNFVGWSSEKYDVIALEPSNPWMAGVASLYTVEFFQDLKRLLKPRGIVGQWIHGYNLWPQDFQMIVRTFLHVFPHTTIWNPSDNDYLLIGHSAPFVFRSGEIEQRLETMPGVKSDLLSVSVRSPLGLLSFFVLTPDDAAAFAQEGPLNRDDLPLLEFSAPKALHSNTAEVNVRLLNASRRTRFPPVDGVPPSRLDETDLLYEWSLIAMVKGNLTEAFDYLNRILAKEPRHAGAYLHRGQIFVAKKQHFRALEDFRRSISIDPQFALAHYQLGLLYLRQKLPGKAVASLEAAVKIDTDNPLFQRRLGDAYRKQKRYSEAAKYYQSSLKKDPQNATTLDVLAFCYLQMGEVEQALYFYRQALSLNPSDLKVRRHLVRAYEKAGKLDVALQELKRMVKAYPTDASAYVEMGRVYLLREDRSRARGSYQEALKIDPQNFAALRQLQKLK